MRGRPNWAVKPNWHERSFGQKVKLVVYTGSVVVLATAVSAGLWIRNALKEPIGGRHSSDDDA